MLAWFESSMHWLQGALALPEVGLSTVFLVSLLSATLLPLGSEAAVYGYVSLEPDMFWWAILIATVGNTIGGAISYAIGLGAEKVYEQWHEHHEHHDADDPHGPSGQHGAPERRSQRDQGTGGAQHGGHDPQGQHSQHSLHNSYQDRRGQHALVRGAAQAHGRAHAASRPPKPWPAPHQAQRSSVAPLTHIEPARAPRPEPARGLRPGATAKSKKKLGGRWHAHLSGWVHRWGPAALLFSWLPVVGDPLCAVAGWLRLSFWPCVAFMAVGKFLRYFAMTGALYWALR